MELARVTVRCISYRDNLLSWYQQIMPLRVIQYFYGRKLEVVEKLIKFSIAPHTLRGGLALGTLRHETPHMTGDTVCRFVIK